MLLRQFWQWEGQFWQVLDVWFPYEPDGQAVMHLSALLKSPMAQVVQLKAVLLQVAQVELHLMHLKAEGKKP